MVTATDRLDVLRVSYYEEDTNKYKTEVVCLVTATDHGNLEIAYQHHTSQSRPTGKGNWDPKTEMRHHTLSLAFESSIRTHIMYELFSTFTDGSSIKLGSR